MHSFGNHHLKMLNEYQGYHDGSKQQSYLNYGAEPIQEETEGSEGDRYKLSSNDQHQSEYEEPGSLEYLQGEGQNIMSEENIGYMDEEFEDQNPS